MKVPLRLQTQSKQSIGLGLCQFVLLHVIGSVGFLELFADGLVDEVLGRHFVEVDVGRDRVHGELFENVGVLARWVNQHVRSPLQDLVVELLERLQQDLLRVELHHVILLLGVLPHLWLLLRLRRLALFAVLFAQDRDGEQSAGKNEGDELGH